MEKRGFLALTIVLALCGTVFATGGQEEGAAASALSLDEKVKMNIMTRNFVNGDVREDQVTFRVLQEKMNIDIDFEIVSGGEYNQKLNLLIASGTLPDVFAQGANMSQYYDEGIFTELTDLIGQHGQNITKAVAEAGPIYTKNWHTDDGRIFFIQGMMYNVNSTCDGIYKPWLDKLGLDIPETLDELYTALRAFKTLGDDIIPMSKGYLGNAMLPIFLAYGTYNNWFYFGGDDYIYGPYQRADRMKEALEFLNKIYEEKLLDTQFLSLSLEDHISMVRNEKVGYVHGWWGGAMWKLGEDGKRLIPEVTDWYPMAPVAGPYGDRVARPTGIMRGTHMFVSSSYDYPERAVAMFDYVFSKEGQILFDWGVEGETYNVVNGEKVHADVIMKDGSGAMNTARREFGIFPVQFPNVAIEAPFKLLQKAAILQIENNIPYQPPPPPAISLTPDEASKYASIMADVNTYVNESIPKFIIGDMSLASEWDAFISQLKKMKIEEAIELQMAGFERWKAR